MEKIALAIFGIGLAVIAAYLEVNGHSNGWLWFGVFLIFITLI